MARPPLNIDADTVRKLAEMGCNIEEISHVLGCSRDTIERRFAADFRVGRANMKVSIRQKQLKLALAEKNPSVPLLIWLGKQYLGQRDTPDEEDSKEEYQRPDSMKEDE